MTKEEVITFNKDNFYIGISKNGYGWTHFAKKAFNPSDKVAMGFGKLIDHQTSHCSIQIGHHKHFLPTKWTGKYWNHSCNPNTYINTEKNGFPSLCALRKIKKDEEITYAYWMSENEWIKNADETHTQCKCGGKDCKGKILSFSQLSKRKQSTIKKMRICSKYLLTQKLRVE